MNSKDWRVPCSRISLLPLRTCRFASAHTPATGLAFDESEETSPRARLTNQPTVMDNTAMTIRTALILALSALATSACSQTPPPTPLTSGARVNDPVLVERGLAFAQARCAACHAIKKGASPHPQAPPFEAITNRQGLSVETLKPWLRNSHDFPAMMNFAIDPERIDELAAYMLTLRDPAYKPAIQ